jgi:glycosyltransferase involved in cell wall biosynthesis
MKTAIIAAFNEEDTIGTVVIKTKKHVDKVIVVDDGSTDKTAEVAKIAGAEVVSHTKNGGKGSALKTGFKFIQNLHPDVVVCLDGDAQHNPDDIPILTAPIEKGEADMVIGSRFLIKDHKKEIPLYRRFGQWMLTATTNFGTSEKITDSQSGFRAFSGDVIDKFSFNQTGFSIESEMLTDAKESSIKIKEVPISMRYNGLNTSTETPGKHGFGVLNNILKIVSQKRPLLLFGVSGMLLLIFGLLFGVYSINFYLTYRSVPFGPSLLAALLILIGVLSVFAGMILNSMLIMIRGQVQMDQRREERLLKNISDQINQKSTSTTQPQASMLLGSIDEKTTPGISIWASNPRIASPNNFDAHNIPWYITLSNSQLLMILEYVRLRNNTELAPLNSHGKDMFHGNFYENGISGLPAISTKDLENVLEDIKNDDILDLVKVGV